MADRCPEVSAADLSDVPSAPPAVELRRVTKCYEDSGRSQVVLADLDMTVGAGEIVAVVGRSGSGKSTLLNLIGALDEPTTGEILIAGASLARLDETARALLRRQRIGFVFQFFNLIPTLTVGENLRLPLELNGVEPGDACDRAAQWLETVGLGDRSASFPETLSGGEQQRLAVARALIHQPALILADEPTGNLDAETAAQLLELLETLGRQYGSTLLIATHSNEAAARCDRVFSIGSGRLLEYPR
ncbi:MAG TPA: ABC transporter ATP-binding protein [Gammaproteobacteria bacterium]|nr:ABC transporter ATP-binding protein [Gammaproteobacteria bacterium]